MTNTARQELRATRTRLEMTWDEAAKLGDSSVASNLAQAIGHFNRFVREIGVAEYQAREPASAQ